MAYTKNTWADGDVVTSAKLNHMEDGIASGESVMVINDTNDTLDKTWQEIYDAMTQCKLCLVKKDFGTLKGGIEASIVTLVYISGEKYTVGIGENTPYTTTSATGYPDRRIGPIIPS